MTTVYYEPSKYIKEKYMNYSISDDISFNFLKPYELPFMRLKVFQYVVKDGEIQDWTTYLKSDAELKAIKPDLRIEQTLGFGLAKDKNATVEEISIKGEVDKSEVHEFFVVYTQKDCDFFKPVEHVRLADIQEIIRPGEYYLKLPGLSGIKISIAELSDDYSCDFICGWCINKNGVQLYQEKEDLKLILKGLNVTTEKIDKCVDEEYSGNNRLFVRHFRSFERTDVFTRGGV